MMGRGGEKSGEPDKIAGPIGFVTYSGFALVLLAGCIESRYGSHMRNHFWNSQIIPRP
jgi:hypothetical protein